jgi:regulatory protein YycI of two-component signal transduction system YycFG
MTELPLRTYMPFTIVLNTQEAMIFFLLDWRQVLSYDVSLLNIHLVVNSLIDSV